MRNDTHQPGRDGASLGLRLDRETVLTGGLLLVVALIAWIGLIRQASEMQGTSMQPALPPASSMTSGTDMSGGMSTQAASPPASMDTSMGASGDMSGQAGAGAPWLPGAIAYLAAWGVMMTAMMLPSALPMIVLFSGMQRRPATSAGAGPAAPGRQALSTVMFALVYLVVWLAFGVPVYTISLA